MACASFFGPLAAKLCDRLGCRAVSVSGALICIVSLLTSTQVSRMWMLYLTYSCLFGFGASCVHTALFLVVSASFVKRRSLATGTLVAGHAAGIMIVTPVLQVLLDNFGWRTSFLLWAGLTSPICVFGFAFNSNFQKELDDGKSSKADRDESCSHKFSIWKHPPFVVYTISTAVLYLGLHVPQVHMVSYKMSFSLFSVLKINVEVTVTACEIYDLFPSSFSGLTLISKCESSMSRMVLKIA